MEVERGSEGGDAQVEYSTRLAESRQQLFYFSAYFPLSNATVVPFYRGKTHPLKRVTSPSPSSVAPHLTYTRSSFLHRLNNAFASVTTCGRDIFSAIFVWD